MRRHWVFDDRGDIDQGDGSAGKIELSGGPGAPEQHNTSTVDLVVSGPCQTRTG